MGPMFGCHAEVSCSDSVGEGIVQREVRDYSEVCINDGHGRAWRASSAPLRERC